MALTTRSDLYRRALELIPGGVNSPVRAMKGVGLDERQAAIESLTAIGRAGADFVVTYWAKELAAWL